MQKNLPKIATFFLIICLGIIVLLTLFILFRAQITTFTGKRIVLNSQIQPYTIKLNPDLDKELANLGFWTRNNRYSTKPAKKLTINILPIGSINKNDLSYSVSDQSGSTYAGGNNKVDENGESIINMYVSDLTLNSQNAPENLDALFWAVFYGTYKDPISPATDQFVRSELPKLDIFTVEK